jgi:hypothetical protein
MATRNSMWFWLAVVVLGTTVMLWAVFHFNRTGSRLFQRCVVDPIPKSVTELRVDRPGGIFAYGYTFRFKINEGDVAAIVASRPFRIVQNVKYENWGGLHFEWSPRSWSELAIYPSGMRKPAWFTPDLWHDPDAYAYEERAKQLTTWVLLYNQQIGEAYFLVTSSDYTP